MKRKLIYFPIVFLLLQLCFTADALPIKRNKKIVRSLVQETPPISKEESAKVINNIKNNTAILVDVRTPEEYADGHLKSSKNINFKADNFKTLVSQFDKNKIVYLYCRTGNRSGQALDTLKSLGFTKVYNLGGFENLKSAGLPAQ